MDRRHRKDKIPKNQITFFTQCPKLTFWSSQRDAGKTITVQSSQSGESNTVSSQERATRIFPRKDVLT